MKNLKFALSLLVLMGLSGLASAEVAVYVGPPVVSAVIAPFPGIRLVYGHPGVYCWYQGRYFSRIAWDRFCRFHPARFAYRYHRGYGRF
jgi:hypothetical protein